MTAILGAVGILSGGIIGAGIFSLPFVFHQAGLAVGFFYLILAATVYAVIHLMYADIILRTKGEHRFVGYTKLYLGRVLGGAAVYMAVVEMLFVLTIYLVLSASFVALLFPASSLLVRLGAFWLLGSAAIFWDGKRVALSELLITIGIVAIIAILFFLGLQHLGRLGSQTLFNGAKNFLLPLPAILFALSGRVAIPSVVKYFKGSNGASIKKTILWGTLLPAGVYALFVVAILGLSPAVTPDSVTGLAGNVAPFILILVGVLGLLSLWSSYILVGLDVKNTLRYDLKLSHFTAAFSVIAAPIILYLVGFTNFLLLVSFVGGVLLAVEGILVIAIWLRLEQISVYPSRLFKKYHPILTVLLVAVFLAALVAVVVGR